jgi:HTH-type transcriptional repressor of NAD biosynthesis genes
MKIGLTLGKFAPLHKGHQYLIETALSEMDEVYVIIYETELIDVPLPIRAGWIRKLYDGKPIRVIEAWDGPNSAQLGSDREYEIAEEKYIQTLLSGKRITHFYSSESYGNHVSQSLGAVDRRVDEARYVVPISATQVRNDAYQYRSFVSPLVYRDLLVRIVFVGAMSTGKSTLSQAMAVRHNTLWMPEYGREYWEKNQVNRRLSLSAFDHIATEHLRREEELAGEANRFLFCDTNALATRIFCLDYHQCTTESLERLCEEVNWRYDLVFLCEDDIPYDDTWDRSGDHKRHVFQRQVVADLRGRKIPFIRLRGSLEERMEQVDEVLSKFIKWSSTR